MEHFDLAVIGSGSGNSLIDERFGSLSVALIDRNPVFGGTCLNVGCIPTKMFVLPADYAASPAQARRLGIDLELKGAHFERVRDRIFGRIDPISASGYQWRRQSETVTVFTREASFVDPHVLTMGDQQISADRIVLANGSRPRMPAIRGLDAPELAPYIHTSDTVMRLDRRPESMIILGGGYIAAEFAHIFSGFGTRVTVINRSDRLLRREDTEICERFIDLLGRRVAIRMNQPPVRVEAGERGGVSVVTADHLGVEYRYDADVLLVAVGRVPNSDTLNLPAAGVAVTDAGLVQVDPHQRTTVDHIWALGDVCSPWQLKHVANAEARTVQHNLQVELSGEGELVSTDHRFVPHAIFSEPQIAAVGATENELIAAGRRYVAARQDYASVAYGWAMEDQGHFVKLLADPDTRGLLGAHIIGPQASTLLQPLVQAMSFGLDVPSMARGQYWLHPGLPEVVENALLALKL